MPLDYGVRRRRQFTPRTWAGIAAAAAVTALILWLVSSYERTAGAGVAQDWNIQGPPCPSVSQTAYAGAGFAARERSAEFDGVTLARQAGHMSCRSVPNPNSLGLFSHPVCQFTSPAALRVNDGSQDRFFRLRPGERATVSVARGQVSCVVGGNFSVLDDPT